MPALRLAGYFILMFQYETGAVVSFIINTTISAISLPFNSNSCFFMRAFWQKYRSSHLEEEKKKKKIVARGVGEEDKNEEERSK